MAPDPLAKLSMPDELSLTAHHQQRTGAMTESSLRVRRTTAQQLSRIVLPQ